MRPHAGLAPPNPRAGRGRPLPRPFYGEERAGLFGVELNLEEGGRGGSIYAVADRLAQPEGKWQPFKAKGLATLVFPRSTIN